MHGKHSRQHNHHNHDHDIESNASTTPASYLLAYMLEHNIHHAEELKKLIAQLKEAGSIESAERVERAFELYMQGNEELALAVKHL